MDILLSFQYQHNIFVVLNWTTSMFGSISWWNQPFVSHMYCWLQISVYTWCFVCWFCSQCEQCWDHWLFTSMPLHFHELAAVHWSQDSWLLPCPIWICQNIWVFRDTGSCRTFAQLCLQAGYWQSWSCTCEAKDSIFVFKLASCYMYASVIVVKIPMHEIAASHHSSITRFVPYVTYCGQSMLQHMNITQSNGRTELHNH